MNFNKHRDQLTLLTCRRAEIGAPDDPLLAIARFSLTCRELDYYIRRGFEKKKTALINNNDTYLRLGSWGKWYCLRLLFILLSRHLRDNNGV